MPHQQDLLFRHKLPCRLPCIWNARSGETSEITPQLFQSMVETAGRMLLAPESLLSLYMSALAQVQCQYSAFVRPFVQQRRDAQ